MQLVRYWLGEERIRFVKIALLLVVSYFFVGISQGGFFIVQPIRDLIINFVFTVFCLLSNWWLFKKLYALLIEGSSKLIKTVLIVLAKVMVLLAYTIGINWFYIEVGWQENLMQTLFFPVVLPLAAMLFLSWCMLYPWIKTINQSMDQGPAALRLELKKGRNTVFCSPAEILAFISENKWVTAITHKEEKLWYEGSLSALEAEVSSFDFFRVNRQTLLSRQAVRGFRPAANDKLELIAEPALEGKVKTSVSRHKAPAVRKWLDADPPFSRL